MTPAPHIPYQNREEKWMHDKTKTTKEEVCYVIQKLSICHNLLICFCQCALIEHDAH